MYKWWLWNYRIIIRQDIALINEYKYKWEIIINIKLDIKILAIIK
jgi:hypothetical protein